LIEKKSCDFSSLQILAHPKLRMLAWNLNVNPMRFGADEGHPNPNLLIGHHLRNMTSLIPIETREFSIINFPLGSWGKFLQQWSRPSPTLRGR